MSDLRVIVLGIDGATWALLRPWADAGELPNLTSLMHQGVHGSLTSTIPPYTAPAWTSFATGKGPGKHGVSDFWRFSWGTHDRVPFDPQWARSLALWSILSRYGCRVGVVNVPVTYPPYPVNGIMVSGMLTPSEGAEYTFPASLKPKLHSAIGNYSANPYTSVSQTRAFLEEAAYWIRQRERANQYLLDRYDFDFFVNVIQAPDPIQHHFWKMLDTDHPLYDENQAGRIKELILDCYRAVDEVIGRRMEMLNDRTQLIVLSDHGFGPAHKYFYVNRFLADLGLLVFHEGLADAQEAIAAPRSWVPVLRRVMRRIDLLGLRHRLLDNRQRESIRTHLDRVAAPSVDWSKTRAYFSSLTGEGIYMSVKGRDEGGIVQPGGDYEAIRDEIIEALVEVRDPETGEAVVAGAYRREEVYDGPYLNQLPDIVLSMGRYPYLPTEQLTPSRLVAHLPPEAGGGRHQPDGIFLAAGGGIRNATVIRDAYIVDVAPTILYALGQAVPADMDGRVMIELFDAEFARAHPLRVTSAESADRRESRSAYGEEEAEAIKTHLRGIGYLA